MDVLVGNDEAEIAETHGHGRDGRIGFAQPRQDHDGDARHRETEHETTHELPQEHRDRRGRIGRHAGPIGRGPGDQDAHEQPEGGDGDRIVQQRFAFRQDRQSLRRPDVPENADHGSRIGRGNHGAQKQADDDVHASRQMHDACDARDTHEDGHDREQQHRVDLVHQTPYVDREPGREQERWQEQGQEQFRSHFQLVEADEGIGEDAEA